MDNPKNVGFGRVYVEDERDKEYPMSEVLSPNSIREASQDRSHKYWWPGAYWGNQERTPLCVAYAWLHWLEDGGITHFYEGRDADPEWMDPDGEALFNPQKVYDQAQKLDQWEGEDYNGTSVRAGAKALHKRGVIEEYRWAWGIEDIVKAILTKGPVVMGTRWYYDMFFPDEDGFIEVGGDLAGGHAYLLNGVNVKEEKFRIKNSWGRDWGDNGSVYISFDDIDRLLNENGEACLAIEKKLYKEENQ